MRVLITGGTGFLGRGLIARYNKDWDITVYSRDEHKQVQCAERWPNVRYVLGDVTNYQRLCSAMQGQDLVIHTAAVKFIPEAERNVLECIDINVGGSNCVFEAAAGVVPQVVAISTDKACLPLNTYGMTKALMERMVVEYARCQPTTKYTACRYGNVIGSTGSVIPKFREQAAQNKYVTITDPDMTRYWISIDEALTLIDMARHVDSGCIVIPQPASMGLMELALCFSDDIRCIGVRPGEKRHEQLLHEQESVRAEYVDEHYVLHPDGIYSEPFMLSSSAPARWMQREEMLSAVEYAATV